jgi:hypothetical protein
MESDKPNSEVLENIGKHMAQLKPLLPNQAIICIGEYPAKILLKGSLAGKTDGVLSIFIDKSAGEIAKWSQSSLDPYNIVGLDANIDTHFWFNVLPYFTSNDEFMTRLKNKPVDRLNGAIMVSSLWDGVGSAMLPTLISKFKEWNENSVALAILPSNVQPSDTFFNALWSLGTCASKDNANVVLIDRDLLESYAGVNRNGSKIAGNEFVNYMLELMMAKETLVQELTELSRSFNVKMYTVLSTAGASLNLYGALENILNTTLFNPLLKFDLSSASVLYVLLRMPLQLKDKLSRGKIELAIARWFKKKASLKSIYITEPIYVEEVSDRIDVLMFVGGFDVAEMFTSMEKEVNALKNQIVKKGLIKEEEWQEIVKSLAAV